MTSLQRIDAERVCGEEVIEIVVEELPEIVETVVEVIANNLSLPLEVMVAFLEEERGLLKEIDNALSDRLAGKILLQVEQKGEAWYVNPATRSRHFLARPVDAFGVMRDLGLGVSENDFESFAGYAPSRLAGRILLRVESMGEAYYVNPDDNKMYFLGRPSDAFDVMRNLGLGISNDNIRKLGITSL